MRPVFLIAIILTFIAGSICSESVEKNLLGGELGYVLKPFGAADPYSAAIGGGIYYERHDLFNGFPLFVGAGTHLYGYYPSDEFFLPSSMFRADLYAGYEFTFQFHSSYALSLSPYVGYGHYVRSIRYADEKVSAYRPVLRIGVIVDTDVGKRIKLGQNISGTIIFDNIKLFALGQTQRLAWRF